MTRELMPYSSRILFAVLLTLGVTPAAEITGVRVLSQVPTKARPEDPVVACEQLHVGTNVVLEVTVATASLAPTGARLQILLRNEALQGELPRTCTFRGRQIRQASVGAEGTTVLWIPWMVPDDIWDLAEQLVLAELGLGTRAGELRWSGARAYDLVYPPPHPRLQPLLGVWTGEGSEPSELRSLVSDADGELTLASNDLVVTFTLLASRCRPECPVLNLLVVPRDRDPRHAWACNRDAIQVVGELVTDPVAGRTLGRLDDEGLRISSPAPANPGIIQEIRVRLLDEEHLQLVATETRVAAAPADQEPAPERRVVRRIEARLGLRER